jgi:hypothetical protein
MKQFICSKPGGLHKGDFLKGTGEEEELLLMEGSKEKGPWYSVWPSEFSDKMIGKAVRNGWVAFMEKEVK